MSGPAAIAQLLPSQPSSDAPSRPPPRKTYGRARAASPAHEPPVFFRAPLAAALSSSSVLTEIDSSPRKALEHRISNRDAKWKDTLNTLHPEPEVSDAEVKRSIEQLRREKIAKDRATVEARKSHLGFGSSSLTEIPSSEKARSSSPRRSSPPRSSSPMPISSRIPLAVSISSDPVLDDEETFPIRKPSTAKTGSRRHIVESSDEEDNLAPSHPQQSSQSSPLKPRSPAAGISDTDTGSTPGKTIRRRTKPRPVIQGSEEDSDSHSTPRKAVQARTRTPRESGDSESDSEQRERPVGAELESASSDGPTKSGVDAFLEKLFAEQQAEAEKAEAATEAGSRVLQLKESVERIDPLFSDQEDIPVPRSKKNKKPTKKEVAESRRDIEKARRSHQPTINRPPPKKPQNISNYGLYFAATLPGPTAVDYTTPMAKDKLAHQSTDEIEPYLSSVDRQAISHRSSTPLAPIEIEQYPSSESRPKASHRNATPPAPTLIPEPTTSDGSVDFFHMAAREDSDEEVEAPEKTMLELMADAETEKIAKAENEQKRAQLERTKAAALAQWKNKKPAAVSKDEDDDSDIQIESPVKEKSRASPNPPTRRNGPDAKAVNNRNPNSVPANTANRNLLASLAGKKIPKKAACTESHLESVGKAWNYSGRKDAEAGAKPPGRKEGRDRPPTHTELYQILSARTSEQARTVREQKERDYGRTKALPPVQPLDIESLAVSARQPAQARESEDEGDDDDSDYQGSGDEESEGEVMLGSGDEEEIHDAEDMIMEDIARSPARLTSPLPEDEDEENASPIKRSKPTRRRVAFASDDEDERVVAAPEKHRARTPLGELNLEGFQNELNLDGFGDDMDGGFSQLFEATQGKFEGAPPVLAELNNGVSVDVFAAMRPDPAALLNAHAVLPKNYVSETQARRDDALVAAELEDAMEPVPLLRTQKKQYLNDAGFFTQTKPSTQCPSQARSVLAGSSTEFLHSFEATEISLIATDVDSEHATSDAPIPVVSPTQQPLTRLRRYDSSERPVEYQPTQSSPLPSPIKVNVNSFLMAKRDKPAKEKVAEGKSAFVEDQAEEEEDDGDGWAPEAGGGDEDDGDDEEGKDKYLKDLVDDQTIDKEEQEKQDALAADKRREDEKEDDARREEQARAVVRGEQRVKRKGLNNEYSDDDGDQETGSRKLTKQQKRDIKEEKNERIQKLAGESNVFMNSYYEGLDSDPDDGDVEEEESEPVRTASPITHVSYEERRRVIREVAKLNNIPGRERDLDAELGLADDDIIMGDEEDQTESSYVVQKFQRTNTIAFNDQDGTTQTLSASASTNDLRTIDDMADYIQKESNKTRRGVGVSGGSVVANKIPETKMSKGDQKYGARRNNRPKNVASAAGKLTGSRSTSFAT